MNTHTHTHTHTRTQQTMDTNCWHPGSDWGLEYLKLFICYYYHYCPQTVGKWIGTTPVIFIRPFVIGVTTWPHTFVNVLYKK